MSTRQRKWSGAILAANLLLLALVLPAQAQVQVGDNVNMNLNGTLSTGYTGDFSNYAGSDHGITFGGNADLNGYYYSPGFVSFDIQPFYNQSRANSSSQSIFDTSGVGATASIFGGSNFPGSITYSKAYNSETGFVLPELGNVTTRGNNQNLGIGWGIHVPDYPSVSLQFMDGTNTNSLFGTDSNANSHSDSFGVNISHTLDGFNLNGGYHYNTLHSVTPAFLEGATAETSDSTGNSFNVGVGHSLPLNGGFSAGFTRSDISAGYTGGSYSATINTVNAGAGFQPIRNLNVSTNTQYTDNLGASLYQPIIAAGGVVPAALVSYATKSLDVTSQASYVVPSLHLTFTANADHRWQTALGTSISSDTFNELATYGNYLLGGFFNATTGITQTMVDTPNSPSTLGLFENVSYTRQVQHWNLSASFNYTRNAQTLLVSYTSTGYGYSGSIGRRIGSYSHWSLNATGSRSMFNGLSGSNNYTQSYTTALSLKRISLSGSYSRASGSSILTPTGLVPTPVGIVNPADTILFGGKSYSAGVGTNLMRGLTISGSYSKALSNTFGNTAASRNSTEQVNAMLQYKLRQLWITAGYLRLVQGFSILGTPPTSGSSYYAGITRWFKFF